MRPFDELEGYLKRIQQRIAMSTLARGAALAIGSALLATVILVWIANAFAFAEGVVTGSRLLLFLVCAFAVSFGIIVPLLRLNQRRTAREVESRFPQFGERLLTCVEQKESGNPFLDLVAADAMKLSTQAAPEEISKTSRIAAFSSAALAALATLAWLILAGPGYFGYGAALLWGATPKEGSKPIYDIVVSPGDKLVRRKADQAVTARIIGFSTNKAQLYAKYQGATKWEQAPMMPQPQGDSFEFLFSNLPTAVEYYVEAGGTKSKTFKLSVVDLPGVKKMRVNYQYPSWTGLKPVSDEQSADLRAVAGTLAQVNVLTDKPLAEGVLVFDDGKKIPLAKGEGNWLEAKVPIEKDGMYHVAAIEQGQAVRLTEDFFIEARPETPPVIRVSKPGRDLKVSPIEEVPIQVSAEDDFAVAELQIRYSVNGGEEKTLNVLPSKGLKQAEGKATLNLEDFKLVPGDVVGFYATAKDARSEARTDMYFIEAQPFERHYQQSQQGGGGGGGEGGEQSDDEISRRQKEIIAATWNQIRDKSANRSLRAENAKFLAEMQAKLRDQARSLARRMQNRELTGASDSFQLFAKDMENAAKEMDAASLTLKDQKFQDSVPAEQRALQHLLRAEARRREIQVAFGQQGGGGGGRGQSGRDLESLFDLELDTEKNQYETGRQQASGSQRQQEIDKALQKLEQLARRQQELAQQAQRNQLTPQQKWQQEMLRREAEQLRREMEQMARGQQQGQQQGQQGQQGQQSQSQGGQPGQQQSRASQGGNPMGGSPSGQQQQQQQQQQQRLQEMMRQRMNQAGGQRDQIDPRVKQALDQIAKAEEDMRRAGESSADARRAAERLSEARGALRGMQQQQTSDQLSDLARRSESLADRQRDFTNRLRQTYGQSGGEASRPGQQQQMKGTPEQNEQFAQEKLKLMEDYRKLESDLKDASRELQSTKKGAAQQLRKALGEVEGEDLALKMKMMSEYLRRGYGSMAWMREQPVTQSLERLRDQVRAAQQAGGAGQDPNGQNQRGVEAALNELEQLRERMSRLAQGRQQSQGNQPGQGSQQRDGQSQPGQQQGQQQNGQSGQQQGQQGQQPGQGGQSGQQGQPQQGQGQQQAGGGSRSGGEAGGATRFQGGGGERRGAFGAMNDGTRIPEAGGMEAPEQAFREGLRDLQQMRQAIRGEATGQEGEDVSREAEALIREMQALDPSRFPGNPKLVEQIRTQLMPRIEQLELMLRRSLDEKNTDQVRSGAGSKIPNGYSDAVAEYYRRLGKARPK